MYNRDAIPSRISIREDSSSRNYGVREPEPTADDALPRRGNDTRARVHRVILAGLVARRASHAALINLVRLFRDGRKKSERASERWRGREREGRDETKGRHEVGRYKW